MTKNTETPDYDHLYDILARRMSIRRLKPDPIPDDYVHKILEAGRWAMSGANSQPWEFVVVKDETVKRELFEAYRDVNSDFIFWMEQMREKPLRHPAYQVEGDDPKAQWERAKNGMSRAWSTAPVLIVILGDGRRQWGTVQAALTFGRHQSHLTGGAGQCGDLDASRRRVAGPGLAARHHPHRGAVQARAGRARSGDDPSHHSGRLAGDGPPTRARAGRWKTWCITTATT